MVQDQILDYVSSQMKLGVSREAISSALVSAGWVVADVEETMKKAEAKPAAMATAAVSPQMGASPMGSSQATTATATATMGAAKPMMQNQMAMGSAGMAKPAMGSSGPQTIRVSDLVSTSASPANAAHPAVAGKITGNSFQATAMPATAAAHKGGMPVMKIIVGILILGLGGLAFYFYSQNAGLAGKIASLNNWTSDAKGQISDLQSQLATAQSGLAGQVQALKSANDDLTLNLSFFVTPTGGASPLPVTLGGVLSGGKSYAVTTPRGTKIVITSSSSPTVLASLKDLVGQVVLLSGTYLPGSGSMTVAAIGGTSASSSPAAAATSTAK